ncbi:MAG: PIN domain-containing protein [Rhodobacteraceae bacterium]|nr:PIN domain-containing protein [Paracoccaceae bacterium]
MEGQTLALSFQSVAELWGWAEAREWGDEARHRLDLFLQRFLIIPYDYPLAKIWARAMQLTRKEGRRLETGDCWILATAVHRKIPLLAHDRDFLGLSVPGLDVISYLE